MDEGLRFPDRARRADQGLKRFDRILDLQSPPDCLHFRSFDGTRKQRLQHAELGAKAVEHRCARNPRRRGYLIHGREVKSVLLDQLLRSFEYPVDTVSASAPTPSRIRPCFHRERAYRPNLPASRLIV